jgi:uncharacterized damage-inducible protein DinB
MIELVKTYYAYNSWAAAKLLNSLESLSGAELTAPGCSGHGSIRDTLAHFMATQWGWVSWFDGSLTVSQAYALKIPSDSLDTIAKARERWLAIDKQATDLVNGLTEEKLRDIWSWSLPTGGSDSLPLWKLLLHVANHGTHTRAQIVAAIRRAGHDAPNIDFLNYSLTVRG